ncbi:MAG: hypothetical protein E6R03_14685 [Hyphomicrobiaceae bacterium]|nr:MAG: hypothetical protein E6R03_14685 [Hyphomicrobiaceae bacterium]
MADVTSAPDATSTGTAQTAQSQATSASTPAPQSTSNTAAPAAATGATQASDTSSKPVNLFELPEFRQYQSQAEKRAAQERQVYQRKLDEMQQQMQQFRLQSASEDDRPLIERDMYKQQLAQLTAEQQRQAALAQQWGDIQRLAEFSGLKAEELWQQNFSNIGDAAFYAMEHMSKAQKANFEKSLEAAIAERERKREANAVDLGGGAPVTTDDVKTRKMNDALNRKDGKSFVLQYLQG